MNYDLERSKLSTYSDQKLKDLYEQLIASIRSGSGEGFVNRDMGHPSYRMGASGGDGKTDWGDDEDRNDLCKLLKALTEEMLNRSLPVDIPIRSWRDFCNFALNVIDTSS